MILLINRLEFKYETYNKLKKELNERQQTVLQYIRKHKTITISEIDKVFKGYARNTLKKDLTYLVNEGFLIKIGEKRGVRYHHNAN